MSDLTGETTGERIKHFRNRVGMTRSALVFTVVPPLYPEPQRFAWFPLAGQRHAINRRDRNVPLGSPMHSLCGVSHSRRPDGDMEWLWPTCELCWDETCKIVGIRPRR